MNSMVRDVYHLGWWAALVPASSLILCSLPGTCVVEGRIDPWAVLWRPYTGPSARTYTQNNCFYCFQLSYTFFSIPLSPSTLSRDLHAPQNNF